MKAIVDAVDVPDAVWLAHPWQVHEHLGKGCLMETRLVYRFNRRAAKEVYMR